MRVVKKETLNLISCWVSKSQDPTMVQDHFLPPLLHAILADYRGNVPQAREPEVLSTVTTIIDKLEVWREGGKGKEGERERERERERE